MKKSLYLFLCSLLGVFLFIILHRMAIFIYLYFVGAGFGLNTFSYWDFILLDYFTLILSLMGGAWYGIWLGLFWYEKVYEEGSHGGMVSHIANHVWPPRSPKNFETKVFNIKQRLEKDLWQLEQLTESRPAQAPEPKVRRVVRKRVQKKTKAE